jgi:hypothetical protein
LPIGKKIRKPKSIPKSWKPLKKNKHEIDCETRKRKLACGENKSEIKLCHWES